MRAAPAQLRDFAARYAVDLESGLQIMTGTYSWCWNDFVPGFAEG